MESDLLDESSDGSNSNASLEDNDCTSVIKQNNESLAKTLNKYKTQNIAMVEEITYLQKTLQEKEAITRKLAEYIESMDFTSREVLRIVLDLTDNTRSLIDVMNNAERVAAHYDNDVQAPKGSKSEGKIYKRKLRHLTRKFEKLRNYVKNVNVLTKRNLRTVADLGRNTTSLIELSHAAVVEIVASKSALDNEALIEASNSNLSLPSVSPSLGAISDNESDGCNGNSLSAISEESHNGTPVELERATTINKTTVPSELSDAESEMPGCSHWTPPLSHKPSPTSSFSSLNSTDNSTGEKSDQKTIKSILKTDSFKKQKNVSFSLKNNTTHSSGNGSNRSTLGNESMEISVLTPPQYNSTPYQTGKSPRTMVSQDFVTQRRRQYPVVKLEKLEMPLIEQRPEQSELVHVRSPSTQSRKRKRKSGAKGKVNEEMVSVDDGDLTLPPKKKSRIGIEKSSLQSISSQEECPLRSSRPIRAARPKRLKEPSLNKKMRRS